MNREQISRIAHTHHPIASPLDDDSVDRLLRHGIGQNAERILDLGCGRAEWLLRALSAHSRVRAEGVDTSADTLSQGRTRAIERGVQDRLTLHPGDVTEFSSPHRFDLVISVGTTYAFGGLLPTLAATQEHLAPGGAVLIGDGFWLRDPTPAAVEMLGESFVGLSTTVDQVVDAGWVPVHGHVSTRQELDDYEWAWTGSVAAWALDHPDDPDSSDVLATATTHRSEWLHTYREDWGFVCLVLRRHPD